MMFERFTGEARTVVIQAQEHARRLGHCYIGCEHLLLAAAFAGEPAGAVLREHGLTPQAVEQEIVRLIGLGQAASLLSALDREALASIGIDLDLVRARIEATFGPDALSRAIPDVCRGNRPGWRKSPPAGLRRRRRRRVRQATACSAGPAPTGHIPFTPRAKKSLEHALREAKALHDNYIGVEHLTLALIAMNDGTVPPILSSLGTPQAALRAAILDRYRQAS
jgi:ATP-dependent Clp protease ATP-binding subunit ClpA